MKPESESESIFRSERTSIGWVVLAISCVSSSTAMAGSPQPTTAATDRAAMEHCVGSAYTADALQSIARSHAITPEEFHSRVIRSAGAPEPYTPAAIQRLIDNAACGEDLVVFDQTVTQNSSIAPIIAESGEGKVVYSVALFKGILAQEPVRFAHYLATGGVHGIDVILRVTFKDGSTRFYDHSGEMP